jgi:hypothetical protein
MNAMKKGATFVRKVTIGEVSAKFKGEGSYPMRFNSGLGMGRVASGVGYR